jgi:chloramphenicol-sensitive protein RarD
MTEKVAEARQENRLGFFAALGAFSLWGFAPLYFKLLGGIQAQEIIAHRVVWSVVILLFVLAFRHRGAFVRRVSCDKRTLATLFLTGVLVGSNWLIFVYAVNSGRVLSTSLGYFINPLVTVLLGMVAFRERLTGLQVAGVISAAIGTLYLTISAGEFPWIALSLALTFGFYGMIRKKLDVGPMVGLFWETLLVLPLAVIWLWWGHSKGLLDAEMEVLSETLVLMGTGLMTVMPLLLFAAGVRRLNLSTIGLMQYIAPTLSFCMAVFVFKESFTADHAITFACIWLGLCLYSISGWINRVRY